MDCFIIIITGIVGATLTFYFSEKLQQGSVRASALLSLGVGLFFFIFPDVLNPYLTKNIPLVFIGASFIGMVSSKAKVNFISLAFAGSLFSLIYLQKSHSLDGFGGGLGTLALISLLITMVIFDIFSKESKIRSGINNFFKK